MDKGKEKERAEQRFGVIDERRPRQPVVGVAVAVDVDRFLREGELDALSEHVKEGPGEESNRGDEAREGDGEAKEDVEAGEGDDRRLELHRQVAIPYR